MKAVLAILLGMGVTAVGCMIWQDLGALVVVSIICTGGMGLLVWIPLWLVIGMAVIGLFSLMQGVLDGDPPTHKGKPPGQPSEQRKPPASRAADPPIVEPEQVMLRNYIRKMQGKYDHSREEITEQLLKKGWTNEAIDKAYQGISPKLTRD